MLSSGTASCRRKKKKKRWWRHRRWQCSQAALLSELPGRSCLDCRLVGDCHTVFLWNALNLPSVCTRALHLNGTEGSDSGRADPIHLRLWEKFSGLESKVLQHLWLLGESTCHANYSLVKRVHRAYWRHMCIPSFPQIGLVFRACWLECFIICTNTSLQIHDSLLFPKAEGIQRAGDVYVCPVALMAHCRISSTLPCVPNFQSTALLS